MPLYEHVFISRQDLSSAQAEGLVEHFSTVPFDEAISLPNGLTLRFRHAGHILGAAHAEIRWDGRDLVFSGDIGRYDDPLFPDPVSGGEPDFIVIESTYGDRIHPAEDPAEALGALFPEE